MKQICAYSAEKNVNAIMKHYLKRVVEVQPENPIDFLLEEIASNPYTPTEEEAKA